MSSEGARGGKTDAVHQGTRDSISSSGQRAVVRTKDSGPGDSLSMGAADTAMASSGVAVAALADSSVRGDAPTEHGLGDEAMPRDAVSRDRSNQSRNSVPDTRSGVSDSDDDDTDNSDDDRDVLDDEDDDNDSLIGDVLLDRYEITRKIGQGGMGAVYEAKHKRIGKRVAVKVLLDKYAHRDLVVARLEQEARLASAIGHEHIIDINDVGETHDGRTFVVMEYLEGESLGACIQRDGPLPEQRAIRIAFQVASALHAAHEKGILHRDVKPENVFLLERKGKDFVKVVDFGISKSLLPDEEGEHSPRLTQTGMVLGTPLYMSPEQARGADKLDRRIDVYSLGVILYEMITGEVPFQGTNYLSIISRVLNEEAHPPSELRPDVSRELEDVIMRALDKDPDRRYQSCEEMAGDLALLVNDPGRTTTRGRISATKYRRKRERRSSLVPLAWLAGITVTISAVVITVVVLMSGNNENQRPEPSPVIIELLDAGVPVVTPDAGAAVTMVKVRFESDPSGASVYQGGRIIGTTPFEYEFIHENQKITLIAELDGHDDTQFDINPWVDHLARTDKPVKFILKKPKRGAQVKKIIKSKPPKDTTNPKDTTDPKDVKDPKDKVPEGLDPNPFKKQPKDERGGQ